MEPDTLFVVGLALGVLSIPAVVSSVSRGERPRIATITLMIAGTMLVWAISNKPGGYSIEAIPAMVKRVLQGFT
ncbi:MULTISPECIES: hypothetical protein [Marivita]|uniref:50S ribosomal protein L35 n=1 Tax=Marivita cryptomonadis TaxID=505252 RepID=A0A9Q2RYP3_9RHOB|nr:MULTISPECIES: hypothetical protein [Marivita]MCR9168163.1 hypothetical protein [Paracoccaceae bacterium]MBM2323072.1 hypothetical protein [Marivita cryptomonadis]MBM2332655.1 hypothetical protein [Marivita cryptomonadis]MBM2342238.1 hypothetical protein [Marivita cryptomonadis]MBM2346903.1 hypothetical protein [Marivita cryptomonadis]